MEISIQCVKTVWRFLYIKINYIIFSRMYRLFCPEICYDRVTEMNKQKSFRKKEEDFL